MLTASLLSHRFARVGVAVALAAALAGWSTAAALPVGECGATEIVSVTSQEKPAPQGAALPAISGNGRYVAFQSDKLGRGDTNGVADVYLRDTAAGTTMRVSVGSGGVEAYEGGGYPSVSHNGRYVTFTTGSPLVRRDRNHQGDVYVHDRVTRRTRLVSIARSGRAAGFSYGSSISASGRYVAFQSEATNLVANDTNRDEDVFVRDLKEGTTIRVSVGGRALQANRSSWGPVISADGTHVVFESFATNLSTPRPRVTPTVYVRDIHNRRTQLVPVSTSGEPANDTGFPPPSISGDGRYVAFASYATNLHPDSRYTDVFVRDIVAGTTEVASLNNLGQPMGNSEAPSISADGRFVAFSTGASDVTVGDRSGLADIYVRDRVNKTTARVSVSSEGSSGNGESDTPSISADGTRVAFYSPADNLAPNDTNEWGDVFLRNRAETCTP